MKKQYYKAIFLEESRHRFICTVLKNEIKEECYVSSSSKLSKYIPLKNCKVLLSDNKDIKRRTRYTLEAVKYNDILYYVNFNKVNQLYEKYLLSNGITTENIYRECIIENIIKTDFFIKNQGCIEIKSLLSNTNKIIFPDISSNRLERQLLQYIELLKRNINVTFVFIAMSSTLLNFEWNNKKEIVKSYFYKAVMLGLKIKAFSVIYEDYEFIIAENIILEKNIIKAILS